MASDRMAMSPIEADWGMNARRGGITGGLRFRHPCPIAGARRQRGTWCATASVKRARAPTMSAGAARAADVTCSVRLLKVRRKPARAFAGARHRGWRACCFLSQSGRGALAERRARGRRHYQAAADQTASQNRTRGHPIPEGRHMLGNQVKAIWSFFGLP